MNKRMCMHCFFDRPNLKCGIQSLLYEDCPASEPGSYLHSRARSSLRLCEMNRNYQPIQKNISFGWPALSLHFILFCFNNSCVNISPLKFGKSDQEGQPPFSLPSLQCFVVRNFVRTGQRASSEHCFVIECVALITRGIDIWLKCTWSADCSSSAARLIKCAWSLDWLLYCTKIDLWEGSLSSGTWTELSKCSR